MLNASQVYSRNTTPHSQYPSSIINRQSLLSRSNKPSLGSIQTLTNGSLYSEIRPSLRSMSSVRLSVYSLFSRQETKSPVSSGLGFDEGKNISTDPEINNQNRNYTVSGISKASTNRVFPASQNHNARTEPQVPKLYDFVMAEGWSFYTLSSLSLIYTHKLMYRLSTVLKLNFWINKTSNLLPLGSKLLTVIIWQ